MVYFGEEHHVEDGAFVKRVAPFRADPDRNHIPVPFFPDRIFQQVYHCRVYVRGEHPACSAKGFGKRKSEKTGSGARIQDLNPRSYVQSLYNGGRRQNLRPLIRLQRIGIEPVVFGTASFSLP